MASSSPYPAVLAAAHSSPSPRAWAGRCVVQGRDRSAPRGKGHATESPNATAQPDPHTWRLSCKPVRPLIAPRYPSALGFWDLARPKPVSLPALVCYVEYVETRYIPPHTSGKAMPRHLPAAHAVNLNSSCLRMHMDRLIDAGSLDEARQVYLRDEPPMSPALSSENATMPTSYAHPRTMEVAASAAALDTCSKIAGRHQPELRGADANNRRLPQRRMRTLTTTTVLQPHRPHTHIQTPT